MEAQHSSRTWNITTLNVRSVRRKAENVLEMMESHNIDILALTETWLKGEELGIPLGDRHKWQWWGQHRRGDKDGGGVGILVRRSSATIKRVQPAATAQADNVLWIRIQEQGPVPPTYVGVLYMYTGRAAGRTARQLKVCQQLGAAVEEITLWSPGAAVILTGDYNARIGAGGPLHRKSRDTHVNRQGYMVMAALRPQDMLCINGADMPGVQRPAHHTFKQARRDVTQPSAQSCIDLVFANAAARSRVTSMKVEDMVAFAPDHHPVTLLLSEWADRSTAPPRPWPRRKRMPAASDEQAWQLYAAAAAERVRALPRVVTDVHEAQDQLAAALRVAAQDTVQGPMARHDALPVPHAVVAAEAAAVVAVKAAKKQWGVVLDLDAEKRNTPVPGEELLQRYQQARDEQRELQERATHLRSTARWWRGDVEAAAIHDMMTTGGDNVPRDPAQAWRHLQARSGDSDPFHGKSINAEEALVAVDGDKPGKKTGVVTGAKQVREVWRKHLLGVSTRSGADDPRFDRKHRSDFNRALFAIEEAEYNNAPECEAPLINGPITYKEVVAAVKRLKAHKARGPDGLAAELLMRALDLPPPPEGQEGQDNPVLVAVQRLCQGVMDTGTMPRAWKTGNVSPFYKGDGDIRDPHNSRPITVVPALSKVYQLILHRRIMDMVEGAGILTDGQCGFRDGRGCDDALFMVSEQVRSRMADKSRRRDARFTYACFVDIRKAYDSVDHMALKVVLWAAGVRGAAWQVISDWLEGTRRRVRVGNGFSKWYHPTAGVPQGEVLSPLLYALFINVAARDLEIMMKHNREWLPLYPANGNPPPAAKKVNRVIRRAHCILYADDICLLATSAAQLQRMLDCLHGTANKLRFQVNTKKTKIMVFRPSKTPAKEWWTKPGRWTMGGDNVPVVKQFKYLGVYFTEKLDWAVHREYVLDKATVQHNKVRSMAGSFHTQHPALMRAEAYANVASICEHGSAIWAGDYNSETVTTPSFITGGGYGKTYAHQIQRLWHRVARAAMGLGSRCPTAALRGDFGVWSIVGRWRAARLRFYLRLALLSRGAWMRRVAQAAEDTAVDKSWSSITRVMIVHMGMPVAEWGTIATAAISMHKAQAHNMTAVRRLSRGVVGAFEQAKWHAECTGSPALARVYAHLGRTLGHLVPYLTAKRRRARQTIARLRCSELYCLGAAQQSRSRPHVPFAQATPCTLCDMPEPEGVRHFVLRCPHWQPVRDKLWRRIAVDAQGEVADRINVMVQQGNENRMLRLMLAGDCSDLGKPDPHERRRDGRPLPHPRVTGAWRRVDVAVEDALLTMVQERSKRWRRTAARRAAARKTAARHAAQHSAAARVASC